ncbi:MAG: aldehyde dehydrogenase [Chloroflexi bacterium]|nr:aldehyde dehydrogenase [Chloroflexota bacterium]
MGITLEKTHYQLLINGEGVDSASGQSFETHNPATNEALASVAKATPEDVDKAVAAAREAFSGAWARISAAKRTGLLFKLAGLLRERFEALARLESLNNGKAITSVKGELNQAIEELEFYAGAANKIMGSTVPVPYGFLNYTLREPIGVCALIVPWNYPILLALRKLAPALAAGNTVVLKPASATPLTALTIGEWCLEAGLPPGTVNVITGPGVEIGSYLVKHPGVDKISFTGETSTGKEIMRMAADSIKRLSLELGGKSPNIVFEDADLEAAAAGSVWAIFYSAGQSCEARSRLFVQDSIYDRFVSLFVEKAKKLRVGDPLDPETHVGALISPAQVQRVESYVQAGLSAGGRVLCGGGRPPEPSLARGNFYLPTALAIEDHRAKVTQEEIFGPVVTILRFKSEAEVVALANDVIYGLVATLWTQDVGRAHRVAGQIRSGVVTINTPFTVFPGLPFGGYKQSGFDREVALEALHSYTELKSVLVFVREKPLNPFGI